MTPFVNTASNESGGSPRPEPGRGQAGREARPSSSSARRQDGPPLVVNWWKGRRQPDRLHQPGARNWLTDQLQRPARRRAWSTPSRARSRPIGGFKTDDGEFGNGTNTYIPETAVYSDGRTGREFVNGYCLEYHKTVHSVLGKDGPALRPQRIHRHPGLPRLLGRRQRAELRRRERAAQRDRRRPLRGDERILDLGPRRRRLPGRELLPVSPADLFMRWTQFGCFSPIMQMHRQVERRATSGSTPGAIPRPARRPTTTGPSPTTGSTRRSTPGCSPTSTPTPSSRARPACRSSARSS